MELLKEINIDKKKDDATKRIAVRAILFDEENKIPILFVSKRNRYKLPGGGKDDDEDKHAALKREILEETGCKIQVEGLIGKINEFKVKHNIIQMNYCYYGTVTEKGEPEFTDWEKERGFELIWVSMEEALELLEKNHKEKPEQTTVERDLTFLKKAFELMNR